MSCRSCADKTTQKRKKPIYFYTYRPNPRRTKWWQFWIPEWIVEREEMTK